MNLCKCGGEVYIEYREDIHDTQHWCAVCNDCETEYPLRATSRLDAIREWNECKEVTK